jgi:hypothetical protein
MKETGDRVSAQIVPKVKDINQERERDERST